VETAEKVQQQQQINQLQGQVQTLQNNIQDLRLFPIVTQLHAAQVELNNVRTRL
jgi:hypothetical protein